MPVNTSSNIEAPPVIPVENADIIDPGANADPMTWLKPNDWPHQGAGMKQFYGTIEVGSNGVPTEAWENRMLKAIHPPWRMVLAWDTDTPVRSFRVHQACSQSLYRILSAIWTRYSEDQTAIEADGLHLFGGAYNYRPKRGSNSLSCHAYGAAIDINPDAGAFQQVKPKNAQPVVPQVVYDCFIAEGWVSGQDWTKPYDPMHFQAAIV